MSCTASETEHTVGGQVRALYETERVGMNENKSSSERMYQVYWNSKNTREVAYKAAAALRFVLYVTCRRCVPARGGHKASCRRSSG